MVLMGVTGPVLDDDGSVHRQWTLEDMRFTERRNNSKEEQSNRNILMRTIFDIFGSSGEEKELFQ